MSEKKQAKRLIWHCRSKIRYTNYLAAMLGASKTPTDKGFPLHIYPCELCGFLHIGTDKTYRKNQRRLAQLQQEMTPDFLAKAPPAVVAKHKEKIRVLNQILSDWNNYEKIA